MQGISGPRTPVEYTVSLFQISTPHQHTMETVELQCRAVTNDGSIVLTIDDSLVIHHNNLYVMNITASNPAGESAIVQNFKLSKLMHRQVCFFSREGT